tara:strand:- start:48 stop:470 length:423 start_codon:yes stop_codon:yes gene_type:complete
MSDFKGMSLYTKEEISKALNNRESLSNKYKKIGASAVKKTKETDTSFKRWGFLWTVKRTAYDDLISDCHMVYGHYYYIGNWLFAEGYIDVNQKQGIRDHCDSWLTSPSQVKNLYNGGKDCYLNPDQARFVNEYKNIEIEE